MEVTITGRYEGGRFDAFDSNYKFNGEFRKNPETDKLTTINSQVLDTNGNFLGNVNGYLAGEDMKYNFNEVSITEISKIADAMNNIIMEL